MENVGSTIIERLYASFGELERAISSAKSTLAEKESVPVEIMKRIESYDGILAKQRDLAAKLCECISSGNWDEVARHVSLINGLSGMIRDDARAILGLLSGDKTKEVDSDTQLC